MAKRVEHLLQEPERRRQLGRRAQEIARQRFDANRHVQDYLHWFADIQGQRA